MLLIQFLAIATGKAANDEPTLEFLSHSQETLMEFLAPELDMAQPQLLQAFEV